MGENGFMVCSPVMGKTVEQMLAQMQFAKENGADCVELRLDCLNSLNAADDLKKLFRGKVLPAIVTYRPRAEGGNYEGDEEERLNVLSMAYDMGADFIEVELQAVSPFISRWNEKQSPTMIIVSSCIQERTPSQEDLSHLIVKIQSTGADIVKVVTCATDITDVSSIFQLIPHCQVSLNPNEQEKNSVASP